MNILVFNCGSSSIKYQLINMVTEKVLCVGLLERIGLGDSLLKHEAHGEKFKYPCSVTSHKDGIAFIIGKMTAGEGKAIGDIKEIDAIGHRVVHAGEEFAGSVRICGKVMTALKNCIPLAPLHNPANIMGIEACGELMPDKPQVGVFDTAFHQTMNPIAYLYAIPYRFYEKYKIRRYGFHGTSHRFVSDLAAKHAGRDIKTLKIITCHLGNGASVDAIKFGRSVDTSMGFTPLEGLIMGTRSGDMDPAIPSFIQKAEGLTPEQVETIFNKESGVKGISGISSDMRDVEDAAFNKGDKRARLALDKYHYQIIKYIGAYSAAMNGVDIIVFTGGVGENGWETREEICKNLTYLGLEFDSEKNRVRGKFAELTKPGSKVMALAIPTNEELTIARDTMQIVQM